MEKKSVVISLFSGPGVGKSTTCAAIFVELKKKNINCDMALEYAKILTHEEAFNKLNNQIYIFGKQHHSTYRLLNKVDVVITDSPLLLSIIYDKENNQKLRDLVLYEFSQLNTINFFLKRKFDFDPKGRTQSEKESIKLDNKILDLLNDNDIEFFETYPDDIDFILARIEEKLEFERILV